MAQACIHDYVLTEQANILIADDLRPRLGDFGLAHMMESQNVNTATSSLAKGTVRWMAPELMVPSAQSPSISNVKTAVDIYAFGCTMLEVCPHKGELRTSLTTIHRTIHRSSLGHHLFPIINKMLL